MNNKIVSMPVSIEQIAAVVRRMSSEDRRRLLDLAPELEEALRERPARTAAQARAAVEVMRQELRTGLEGYSLSSKESFLGNLTLGDYLALPDGERARLWDEWAGEESWEEVDVLPDAMSSG